MKWLFDQLEGPVYACSPAISEFLWLVWFGLLR